MEQRELTKFLELMKKIEAMETQTRIANIEPNLNSTLSSLQREKKVLESDFSEVSLMAFVEFQIKSSNVVLATLPISFQSFSDSFQIILPKYVSGYSQDKLIEVVNKIYPTQFFGKKITKVILF